MVGASAKDGEIWDVVVVGGGPSGLAAAETASAAGARTLLVERMPSVGRKLLMAGKSGLNLTMDTPLSPFLAAYRGSHAEAVRKVVSAFGPKALREWAAGLGVATFAGSSGKVFPNELKASPLLRAWLARLRAQNVAIRPRARLAGLERETGAGGWGLNIETSLAGRGPDSGTLTQERARVVVLALGGASWPRLGSDARWTDVLVQAGRRAFAV